MENRFRILLIIFFAVALLIRIIGLNLNIYTDETAFSLEAKDGFKNFGKIVSEHPPIPIFLYSLYGSLFGNSNVALRLVPFTFAALSLIMVYFLAKTLYDKKVAIVSVSLMAVGFWHTLASLQLDIDGALLSFMVICSFFCYLRYNQTNSKKWLISTGIFFGFGLLTKLTSILILPILLSYDILSKKPIKNMTKSIAIISIIGFIIFLVFPLYSYIFQPDYFWSIFKHASGRFNFSFLPLIYLLIWGTPLLVIMPLLGFNKLNRNELLLVMWIIIPILFYIFVGTPYQSPYERYLMIIILPLGILSGKYIVDNFNKRHLFLFVCSFVAGFVIFYLLNLNTSFIPHSIDNYVSHAINLKWNFYFPITGSSGPVFGINFSSLALVYIVSAILIALLIISRYKAQIFHIFIALVIAFNLFLVQEMVFHAIHPDFNKAISDVGNYFIENKMPLPIYTNQLSYLDYLNLEKYSDGLSGQSDFFMFTYNSDEPILNRLESGIRTKKGTILLVDYPIIDKSSRLWEVINQCEIRKIFYSKSFPVGYVFDCG